MSLQNSQLSCLKLTANVGGMVSVLPCSYFHITTTDNGKTALYHVLCNRLLFIKCLIIKYLKNENSKI